MKNPAGVERGSRPRLPTVAEALELYLADQPATRASTYRSRIRPLIELAGTVSGSEALLCLPDVERDLAAVVGSARAHAAIAMLLRALRDAGARLLTLSEAAAEHGISIGSLLTWVDAGRIRYRYRRRHGRGESVLFDPEELVADLGRLPRCLEPCCPRAGTGRSGYCGEHFASGGRDGARRLERETLNAQRGWLTFSEAVRESGRSPVTVSEAVASGELSSTKIGRHRRIDRSGFDRWLTNRGRGATIVRFSESQQRRHLELTASWYSEKLRVGEIATRLGVSKPTVYRYLYLLRLPRGGQGRLGRRLLPHNRTQRRERTAQLYLDGLSLKEVANANDSSATQVARDLKTLGIARRGQRRRPKYPAPDERACERCGQLFTPRFPSADIRGGEAKPRRYHSDHCARAARAEARQDALAERGLLGTSEIATALHLGERRVWKLIDDNLLVGERVNYPGQLRPAWGVRPEALRSFLREWVAGDRSQDRRRLIWQDPDRAVAQLRNMGVLSRRARRSGLTIREAEVIARASIEARAKRLAAHRRGRKPGGGPPAHHLLWKARFLELERDLTDAWENDPAKDGDRDLPRPTRRDTAAAVAEEDWREHPDRWGGYPASAKDPEALDPTMRRAATDRVLTALNNLNRLQTARSRKAAA